MLKAKVIAALFFCLFLSGQAAASSGGGGIPIFTTTSPGAVPASGGGTANFMRADGTWAAPSLSTPVTITFSGGTTGFTFSPSSITIGSTTTTYTMSGGTSGFTFLPNSFTVSDNVQTTVTLSGGTSGFSFSPTSFSTIISSGGGGLSTINQINSGSSNTLGSLTTPRTTQAWNSSTASVKTQNIPACSLSYLGYDVTLKDEYGNAGTYAISVVPTSGTIDGLSSSSLSFNYQSITYECDGVSNWMVM